MSFFFSDVVAKTALSGMKRVLPQPARECEVEFAATDWPYQY
jgi:hypothetical protein